VKNPQKLQSEFQRLGTWISVALFEFTDVWVLTDTEMVEVALMFLENEIDEMVVGCLACLLISSCFADSVFVAA